MPSSSYTTSLTQAILSVHLHQQLNLALVSQPSLASPQESSLTSSPTSSPTSPQPTAHLTSTTTPLHLVSAGTLHGGITSLLIDAACYVALVPTLSDGQTAATIASSFQILNAVRGEGKVLDVEGRVLRRGKGVAFCEGVVRCDGVVVGRGMVTKIIVGEGKGRESKL